jgi:ankyrin repeat protein
MRNVSPAVIRTLLLTVLQDGWTPLMYAAEQGRESVIKLLIDCGSDRSAAAKVENTHYTLTA